MKVLAVVATLLAGCAVAQLNADLSIDVAGFFVLVPALSGILTMQDPTVVCAPRVRVLGDTTNNPAQDTLEDVPYQLYPPSSIFLGIGCEAAGNQALAIFVDSVNAQSLPSNLFESVQPILEDENLGPTIAELAALPESAVFVFMREATCGGRAPDNINEGNPAGITFIAGSDTVVLGTALTEGVQYFHYITITNAGELGEICSYAENTTPATVTPSASDGASGSPAPSTTGGPSGSPSPSTSGASATATPTPSATATPTPTATAAPCFPGSSTVELESGEHVAMDALEVGHRVRVSGDEFSDVFFFGHKVAEEVADYVKVTTEAGNALWIAPNHYMYANSRMVAAGAIKVGDSVELGSGDVAEVVSVEVEKRAGLYAPHTMHGDIVVDGVRASTYTQVVHPTAAKMLLWPLKVLYRLRLPAVKVLEKASRGKLARTIGLPKGPLVL